MKKDILLIVIAFTLALLILSGCAHKTVKTVPPSPDGTVDATPIQNQDESPPTVTPSEAEDTGDVFSEIEDV